MSPETALAEALATNLVGGEVHVLLASMPDRAGNVKFARLGLQTDLSERFKDVVQGVLNELAGLQQARDLSLVEFDAGYKADSHELAWLEISQAHAVSTHLAAVPSALEADEFYSTEDFVEGLHHYVIMVEQGDQPGPRLFRKCTRKIELGRSGVIAAVFRDGRYDKADDKSMLFDDKIDCFSAAGKMFVRNAHNFQAIFRYHDDLRRVAEESLRVIEEKVPIANFAAFAESCKTHVHKLAKLRNIAAKPYLQHITMGDIKQTISDFSLPGVKVESRNGQEVLVYDESDRWVVLKLLDDDYLGSTMTKQKYEVNSKRHLGQ